MCPEGAITEVPRVVGVVERGSAGELGFVQGRLAVGEAMATPVIRAVKKAIPTEGIVILDAPPGTSCPVVETIRGVDWVIMVTEPTPFGLNDLKLAVGAVRKLGLTTSIVINRSDVGDSGVVVGDTGTIVAPGDPQALADAITTEATLPREQRRARGLQARQRILDNFTIESMTDRFTESYKMKMVLVESGLIGRWS